MPQQQTESSASRGAQHCCYGRMPTPHAPTSADWGRGKRQDDRSVLSTDRHQLANAEDTRTRPQETTPVTTTSL